MQIHLEREDDSEMFEDFSRYLKTHPHLTRFVFNPAGLTFLFGWSIALGLLVGWIGIFLIDSNVALDILVMLGAQTTTGREGAIPVGISLGLPALMVFGISFTWDLVTTTWFYPLFYIFRRRQRGRHTFWGYLFKKIEAAADKRRAFVERYGAVGLFLFMLIPFAINGPLIGAVLGKLAGIRTRYILPTVVLATATATGSWLLAWLYFEPQVNWVIDRVGGEWIALAFITIVLLVLVRVAVGFLKDVREYREQERQRLEYGQRLEAKGDVEAAAVEH